MRIRITLAILLLAPTVASAAPDALSREALLDFAVEHSPRIASAAADWRAAQGVLRQARLYPNPEAEFEQSDLRFGEDEGMTSVAVGQPIIVGGRRDKEIALAKISAEVARTRLELAIREELAKVDRLHVRMMYHHADLDSQFELLDEAEATLATAEESKTSESRREFLKARIERDRIQLEVTRHSAEVVYTLQELSVALGGMEFRSNQFTGELSTDYAVTGSSDGLVIAHPRYRLARLAVEEETARRALLGRSWIPDVTVRVGAGWREETDEAIPFAGLRIPLPLWNRNQGSIAEATSRITALTETAHAVELELSNTVTTNLQQLNEFDTFATEYRLTILPDAKQALEASRTRYAQGEDTHLDVLDSQRVYTEARATYYGYLLQYNELLVERRALEGYEQEKELDRFAVTRDSGSPAARRSDR
ncbi:hypothetical protein GC173_06575 [bacterium]|nr:hypothetical protein [bacterium]